MTVTSSGWIEEDRAGERTGQQYGLVTVCAAGGIGVAMVLERE